MLSRKNKNRVLTIITIGFFFTFIFAGFFGFTEVTWAKGGEDAVGQAVREAAVISGDNAINEGDNIFTQGAKYLLYAILLMLIELVQVAASLFEWATRPEYISGPTGLLNLEAVYTLWKFIRDFFNLFFIFLLLASAFGSVFQVESFNIRKNFFKIIGAAIIINFSFPIARIIIDFGNVPMYFFRDTLVNTSGAGGNALQSIPTEFFKNSNITDVALRPSSLAEKDVSVVNLFSAVIFTFIFMITLLVLAILFVIRLLKLVIILIFSPFGMAASIVPGLASFGKDWWTQLIKTVFFGPAAMLIVVVALRFTAELNNSGFSEGLSGTAPAASGESQSSIIAKGLFFIPIILMWFAMGIGTKFGIQGAGAVIGKAKQFSNWAKKQATFGKGSWTRKGVAIAPGASRVRGAYKGAKTGLYEGRLFGKNYGDSKFGKWLAPKKYKERGEDAEAAYKGFINKGSKGVEQEKRKAEDRRINEKMKEFKDDNLSRTDLEYKVLNGSELEKKAAALAMAEGKDGIKKNTEVMAAALALFANDWDKYEKVLKSSDDDAISMKPDEFGKANYAGIQALLGRDGKTEFSPKSLADFKKVIGEIAEKRKNGVALTEADNAIWKANEKIIRDFGKQIKKTGGDIDTLFEYQTGKSFSDPNNMISRSDIEKLYNDHKLTTKDLSQQSALIRNKDFQDFAKQSFTITEANELAKFVVQNNKNPDVRVIVEGIKNSIVNRGANPASSGAAPKSTAEEGKREKREAALAEAREKRAK